MSIMEFKHLIFLVYLLLPKGQSAPDTARAGRLTW